MKWISILIWLLFWGALLFSQTTVAPAAAGKPTINELFKTGYAAYLDKQYDVAVQNYNRAISIDATRNYLYYNRAMAYLGLGMEAAAANDFRKSIDLRASAEAYYQLGMIEYHKNDFSNAKADLENSKMMNENMEGTNFYLGLIYFKDEQFDESLKCFKAYTATNHGNPEAFYYQGYCEAKLSLNEDAILSLKQASACRIKDWRYYFKMYEVYKAVNAYQEALNNLSMVIELGQRKPEYFAQRAELFKTIGDESRAADDLQNIEQLKANTTASVTAN